MGQIADIHVKIDPTTKTKAVKILELLGITPSQVISALFQQIIYTESIPFAIKLPNKTTIETFRKTDAGVDLHRVSSINELAKELKA